jgi:hypothetical protein
MPLRKFVLAGALALLVAVGIAGPANPAQAVPRPPTYTEWYGHVHNSATTKCLDSGIPANAQMWSCSSAIYQQWYYNSRGKRLEGNSPAGCLDDGAGLNGSGAFLTACTGGLHQRWYYDGSGAVVNAGSGRCLDWDMATIKVQVWDCNYGANQLWTFEFVNEVG